MTDGLGTYGLLGDTRTAALVSASGSIDWLCVPRFDGAPVFGKLIDPERGGRWSLAPVGCEIISRAYTERAASIRTEWAGPGGRATVREGMIADASSRLTPHSTLVRQVACTSGSVRVEMLFEPRLGLPGARPGRVRRRDNEIVCSWGGTALSLAWNRELDMEPGSPVTFEMRAGESVCFVAGLAVREPIVRLPPEIALEHLDADDRWWRNWAESCAYEGPHEENIARSLITLRLLTYAPSGAPVAAPTTSLPAPAGGTRNWDYRFSWPRDASIGVGAFLDFGRREEPRAFLGWLINAARMTRPRIDVLYTLDGRPIGPEREIAGVHGFGGARPVRVGNAASEQHQLDVYGWVLDAAWRMHDRGERLTRPQWRALRHAADLLARTWREPDHGIWEQRVAPQQYVHSKLLAWTGLDRACRLAQDYPAKERLKAWGEQCALLAEEIRARGFDARRATYTRTFDGSEPDASLLILPALGFDDDLARLHGTIDAVRRELGAGGALLYRYPQPEGDREGAFLPCSFWLVQALAISGRLEEAEEAFDELCALATPLGLYAEQVDPVSRTPLGNFPQAFTHATFLSAAAALNEARGRSRGSTRRERAQPSPRPESARRS